MNASVTFPHSGSPTTPLGIGMATLMREPSSATQQRLLHAAYDAGFRHFDVAPSYGLGTAEAVLGRFLRSRPEGVTVGTKVGILARGNPGIMRLIQRPARALLRRFPGLRGQATKAVGSVVHVPTDFSIPACERSLHGSLRALGVEAIELYLLHDPRPADVSGELVEWLVNQRARGTVRNLGVAASPGSASAIFRAYPGVFDACQTPSHVLSPARAVMTLEPRQVLLTHGVLAPPLAAVAGRLDQDPTWAREVSTRLGADIRAPGVLPKMLLAWGLLENQGGTVLVGASKDAHIRAAPSAVGAFAPERLEAAAAFLRATIQAT